MKALAALVPALALAACGAPDAGGDMASPTADLSAEREAFREQASGLFLLPSQCPMQVPPELKDLDADVRRHCGQIAENIRAMPALAGDVAIMDAEARERAENLMEADCAMPFDNWSGEQIESIRNALESERRRCSGMLDEAETLATQLQR